MEGSNSTVTEDGPCRRTLHLKIDQAVIDREIERGLAQTARRTRFKGFRPGKAPLDMVIKAHGQEVADDVRRRLMSAAFSEALSEHGLRPVGDPEMRLQDEKEEGLSFECSIEVPPEFELQDVTGIPVTVRLPAVDEKAVDAELERFRDSRAHLEDAPEEATVAGDSILHGTVLYVVDGAELEPKTDRPAFLRHDLVDGLAIPGSAARFEGQSKGDTVEFEVTLPETFKPEEHAGQAATLRFTIERYQLVVLPPWDEDLLQQAGVESLDALRQRVKERLDDLVARQREEQADHLIRQHLIGAHGFELPERMLAKAVDRRIHEHAHRLMEQQGLEAEEGHRQAEEQREAIVQATTHALKASFIYSRIASDQSLNATAEEAEKQVRELARLEGKDAGRLVTEARTEGWMADVAAQLTEQKTRSWLRSQARITEEEVKAAKDPS